ncbi:hypothetical protein BST61_g2601 [Cercospora zeina]
MAGNNSGKKKGRDNQVNKAATSGTPFRRMLQTANSSQPTSQQGSARIGDSPASPTRQKQSARTQEVAQTREVINMTGDKETPQARNEKDKDALPSGATSAQGQKRKLSEGNSKASAETTKEFIDLTGAQEISTRITEDEWREKVGLPKIKRAKMDLTEEREQS